MRRKIWEIDRIYKAADPKPPVYDSMETRLDRTGHYTDVTSRPVIYVCR